MHWNCEGKRTASSSSVPTLVKVRAVTPSIHCSSFAAVSSHAFRSSRVVTCTDAPIMSCACSNQRSTNSLAALRLSQPPLCAPPWMIAAGLALAWMAEAIAAAVGTQLLCAPIGEPSCRSTAPSGDCPASRRLSRSSSALASASCSPSPVSRPSELVAVRAMLERVATCALAASASACSAAFRSRSVRTSPWASVSLVFTSCWLALARCFCSASAVLRRSASACCAAACRCAVARS